MTLLQLVNRVLRRLREDEVTDFTADYTQLILDFVAEVHADVIQDHDWSIFEKETRVNVVAGQNEYDLSLTRANGGDVTNTSNIVRREAVLRYEAGDPLVHWHDTTTSVQGLPVKQASWQEIERLYHQDTSRTSTFPEYFALRQNDIGWEMFLWPTPDNSATDMHLHFYNPEALLDPDTATVTDTIKAPNRPIILGALMFALNERGEELGEPGNLAEANYLKALYLAKENDIMNSGRVNRFEFYRD